MKSADKKTKEKRFRLVFGMFFLMISSLYFVFAVPSNPESYWGYIYVEGDLAPDECILTVETAGGELLVNQTIPLNPDFQGSYSIIINFDDLVTPQDEGAEADEQLVWKVDGINTISPAPGQDTAEPGKTNNNFTVIAILNPVLTAGLSYSNQSIMLGEWINLTVVLDNNGDGTANVTLLNLTGEDNLTADLPKYLQVPKNETRAASVAIVPYVCGVFNPYLTIDYYNLEGALTGTLIEDIDFQVKGYDIEVQSLIASNYSIKEGSSTAVTAFIANQGDLDINGFKLIFYDNYNEKSIIKAVNTNLTLAPAESTRVIFNWEPEPGNYKLTVVANITETECKDNNNIKNSSMITVGSESSKTGRSSSGRSSGSSYASDAPVTDETIENITAENTTEELDKTRAAENITQTAPVTAMAFKRSDNYTYRKMLSQFILMLIGLFGLLALYYGFRKEEAQSSSIIEKLPVEEEPEARPQKLHIKNGIEKMDKSGLQAVLNRLPASDKKEKPRFETKSIILNKKAPEIKVTPKSAVYTGPPVKPKPPVLIKPRIRASKDAAFVNVAYRIKNAFAGKQKKNKIIQKQDIAPPKKIEIRKPVAIQQKKTPLLESIKPNKVPYEYLDLAIDLVEKITANKQPVDKLIAAYKHQYPELLIRLVGKQVFLNALHDKEINVTKELGKLGVLDKNYEYISYEKLEKAVDILAKGYSLKNN